MLLGNMLNLLECCLFELGIRPRICAQGCFLDLFFDVLVI